jgi:DNA-binding transcriptional ArsR family regulator
VSQSLIDSPMVEKAAAVAVLFRTLGNEKRLLVLCKLLEAGEATVSAIAESVGLGQSATSQHLAMMREEGLIAFRLDALLAETRRLYCDD